MSKDKLNLIEKAFFAFYFVLPSYFAIEISNSLPLMTASRILLVITMFVYVIKCKGIIKIKIIDNNYQIKYALVGYFSLMLLANILNIKYNNESIKEILALILEQLCFIWIISKIIDSKEKLREALKVIAITSLFVAVIAIIGSITGKNLFYNLNFVKREMLMASYSRLGFTRAEAGFGHPVYYGAYIVIIIPIIMYLIETEEKCIIYKIALIFNVVALFFSNSRGSIIAFAFIFLYITINQKWRVLKKYLSIFVIGIVSLVFVSIISPKMINFFGDILKSIYNVFSSDQVYIQNYGQNNANGLNSRINQISGIVWTLKHRPIIGFGANAHMKEMIKFCDSNGKWIVTDTFDIGYVAIFCQYGIVGSLGYIILYLCILKKCFEKNKNGNIFYKSIKYCFISYLILMISVVVNNKMLFLIVALMISNDNILKNTKNIKKDWRKDEYTI